MTPAEAVADLRLYLRFAAGLRQFLSRRITLERAQTTVRARLAERDASFLRLLERGVFGYPRSPYRQLFDLAGCELGDAHSLVRRHGLEGALLELHRAGVRIGFEEFKGRAPIVRGGRELAIGPRDFDNPFTRHAYLAESGGSTGAGARVEIDLDFVADVTPNRLLADWVHGAMDAPTALWAGLLPDARSITSLLSGARMGNVPRRWFSTVAHRDARPALRFRLASYGVVLLGRALGVPFPWPQAVPMDDAQVVARWAARVAAGHGTCALRMTVSQALRVSSAAQREGLDLSGVVFFGGGEPPTTAKVQGILRSGARYAPMYWFAEVGPVGVGCARPTGVNDLHLLEDVLALVQAPRRVPGFDVEVGAFAFTSLLASAPKLLINVESDDYGILEPSTCGCPLEQIGYRRHVREVRSYRKLTGEGVTLVGSDMERILEEVLPARFGGSPLDYQLVEEEAADGFTRLTLVVSPNVGDVDETAMVERVLEELRHGSAMSDAARAMWSQAGTLRVRRAEPTVTARGKLLTLRSGRENRG